MGLSAQSVWSYTDIEKSNTTGKFESLFYDLVLDHLPYNCNKKGFFKQRDSTTVGTKTSRTYIGNGT
ncbi:hypothetical protein P700755_002491 [Psychroflexus torquis ATCC 700755]|uniref:Uncharacterized protein n=1 Tax=Psychroflexus torquis (strain ATCC 700755 / CIP 106069 / ACAM 623) TaxID=313595 RepID=K4IFD0_PSYTT|nr:hypothetical protein [Psychroflexus torquis]AFU69252.1 hypothetical protein P700755_002491 [Psychroflexus torquis ATCC 700755]